MRAVRKFGNDNFDRIENGIGWVILSVHKHKDLAPEKLTGHLVLYAQKLISRMIKPISIDRLYEILEEQVESYLETGRRDSVAIIRKEKLTGRRQYPFPLYKIEIGNSQRETLACIFMPTKFKISR